MITCTCDLCGNKIINNYTIPSSVSCGVISWDMDGNYVLIPNSSAEWHICKECATKIKEQKWLLYKDHQPNSDKNTQPPRILIIKEIVKDVQKLLSETKVKVRGDLYTHIEGE